MHKDRITLDLEDISNALQELEHQLTCATVSLDTVRIAVENLGGIRRRVTGVIGRECYGIDIGCISGSGGSTAAQAGENDREGLEELARRFCCAWTSYQAGLTYQHCLKTYIRDAQLGPYWYGLAERVARDFVPDRDSQR